MQAVTRALVLLALVVVSGCVRVVTVTTPGPPRWQRATFDYSSVYGPFPPEPVQPLPEAPQSWYYTALERDEIATRFVLTPDSLVVPRDVLGGLKEYDAYPLLLDSIIPAQTAICLPPPPQPSPRPPGVTPWTGELCQRHDALEAWLTGWPTDAFVGDLPDAPPQPFAGPFGDLQFVGANGPDWIHVDTDPMRSGWHNGAMQFEPASKRIVMTVGALESGEPNPESVDGAWGWRIHPDVDGNALVCVEFSAAGGQHQERCTAISRLREWLVRYGKPMPPVYPVPIPGAAIKE